MLLFLPYWQKGGYISFLFFQMISPYYVYPLNCTFIVFLELILEVQIWQFPLSKRGLGGFSTLKPDIILISLHLYPA
ncbi:hypothetical protein J2X69_004078 [Algoriphagus sp. 4150]|nr:hypothetical protein [Algoriphagus sp. 4150]